MRNPSDAPIAKPVGSVSANILTAKEVAAELRISKAQVYRLINGEVEGVNPLPYLPLGRKKVLQRASLEAWKRASEMNRAIVGGDSEVDAVDALA